VLRLLAGPVREPDNREPGNPTLQVRLHLDTPGFETDERVGESASDHALTLRGELRRLCAETVSVCDGDEDRLEVLPGAPPRSPVDVPLEPILEP